MPCAASFYINNRVLIPCFAYLACRVEYISVMEPVITTATPRQATMSPTAGNNSYSVPPIKVVISLKEKNLPNCRYSLTQLFPFILFQAQPGEPPRGISRASLRAPLYQTAFDHNKEVRVVHREVVANPAPLGLFAFGLTTALLQGANTAITEKSTGFLVYAFAMFYGGLAQVCSFS
jgi:hypothetical protein